MDIPARGGAKPWCSSDIVRRIAVLDGGLVLTLPVIDNDR